MVRPCLPYPLYLRTNYWQVEDTTSIFDRTTAIVVRPCLPYPTPSGQHCNIEDTSSSFDRTTARPYCYSLPPVLESLSLRPTLWRSVIVWQQGLWWADAPARDFRSFPSYFSFSLFYPLSSPLRFEGCMDSDQFLSLQVSIHPSCCWLSSSCGSSSQGFLGRVPPAQELSFLSHWPGFRLSSEWWLHGATPTASLSIFSIFGLRFWFGCASLYPAEEHLRGIWGRFTPCTYFFACSCFTWFH